MDDLSKDIINRLKHLQHKIVKKQKVYFGQFVVSDPKKDKTWVSAEERKKVAEALKELIDLDEEPEEDSMQDDMDAFIPVLNKIRDTIAEGSLFKHEHIMFRDLFIVELLMREFIDDEEDPETSKYIEEFIDKMFDKRYDDMESSD